jgi:hypothetical protein
MVGLRSCLGALPGNLPLPMNCLVPGLAGIPGELDLKPSGLGGKACSFVDIDISCPGLKATLKSDISFW